MTPQNHHLPSSSVWNFSDLCDVNSACHTLKFQHCTIALHEKTYSAKYEEEALDIHFLNSYFYLYMIITTITLCSEVKYKM